MKYAKNMGGYTRGKEPNLLALQSLAWPIYSKSLYLYYTILEQYICRNVLDVDKTIRYLFGSLLFLQYEEICLHMDKSNIDDIAF